MIEQMCAYLDEDILVKMIEDTYGHHESEHRVELACLIENVTPQYISDGAILDPQTFGRDNLEIFQQIQLKVRNYT
jgi:hypothetical protein